MAQCDFCENEVEFERIYQDNSPFWYLVAVTEGAGSDHLAIWCADCGPLHRFPKRESESS